MTGIIILILHLAGTLLCIFLWKAEILKVPPSALIILTCIPLGGEAILYLMHLEESRHLQGRKAEDLKKLRYEKNRDSLYRQHYEEDDSTVVPLEDALILNNTNEKRSAMLNVLMDDSGNYMNAIRQAKRSDDSEVVHYATSAMTEISGKYEERLQLADRNYQRKPDSPAALDEYIDILEQYLENGIVEGELLEIQRHQYQKLLKVRIHARHRQEDYTALASSYLDSGLYEEADRIIRIMERRWMKYENTLLLRLRYLFLVHDGEQLQKLIQKVKEEPYIPEKLEQMIRFWENPQ